MAAHEAAVKETICCFVADHMACPKDDHQILSFIYQFVDHYRNVSKGFHSCAIIFAQPENMTEEEFDVYLWQRLQALNDMDAKRYPYDNRVTPDITSPNFSFSLKEEAFYVIGIHPSSSRLARKFDHPVLVFNPHSQFEKLREEHLYHKMQNIVRKRDEVYSGSVNPMLADFGEGPEVFQYSGRQYESDWKCPLQIRHAKPDHHSSA